MGAAVSISLPGGQEVVVEGIAEARQSEEKKKLEVSSREAVAGRE